MSEPLPVQEAQASYQVSLNTPCVRPGFKYAGVGLIPESWEVLKLGNVADKMVGGGTPSRSNKAYWGGDIPWVTVKDFATFNPYFTQETITKEGLKNSASHLVQKGTVITSTRMALGKAVIYAVDVTINQDLKAIYPTKDISSLFLFYWFQKKGEYIDSLGGGSTVKGISLPDLRAIEFLKPPLPEQNAIATTLSDIDAFLELQDKLIAKKRNIKQAAMQQLLTGKQRLPGFTEEWVKKELKDIVQTPVTDGPHMTPKFLREGVPFLSVNNLINNKIDFSETRYVSREDHEIFSQKCKPAKNDLLLGKAASVGKVAIVDTDIEFNIWSPIALIRLDNNYLPQFIYYCFQERRITRQIELLTNSSSQGNIGMGEIERLVFIIPNKDEQTAIATILSDMDADLEALELQRDKTRALKQGMMQELLTGRIRLV